MINDIDLLMTSHNLFCLQIVPQTGNIAHSTEQQKSAKLRWGICNVTLANLRMEEFRFRQQQQKKLAHFPCRQPK